MKIFICLTFMTVLNQANAQNFTESASTRRLVGQTCNQSPQYDAYDLINLEKKVQEQAEERCYETPIRISVFRHEIKCKILSGDRESDIYQIGDMVRIYKVEAEYVCPPEPACRRLRYPC